MANALNENLDGKVVIFDQQYLSVPAEEYPFKVEGGFGRLPFTSGSALAGVFLTDGERARMEGYMVARLATEEEIKTAEESREHFEREQEKANDSD